MTESYKKLIATLEEIFQLDQADLDFGIYRIMNQKREEINDFLQNKLLTQINNALTNNGAHEGEEIARQLEETLKQAREMGVTNPEDLPKVQELKEQYQAAGSPVAMSNDVFSHLTNFFRRYYNQGDFISQRRYKKDVYAIPYEGEEVKLHWANHDQYYIKTGENFRNYSFKTDNGHSIHFRLRDAQTEQNNNKAQQGKERRFQLAEDDIITEEANELIIWFTYDPTDKKTKQDELNADAVSKIKSLIPEAIKNELLKPLPTKSNPGRTLLEKHLKDYTAKNTFDYFIHKDLGGFLNRELDFYIKNEILNIDDINLDSPQSFEKQLRVIKALKTVARKIIALLAQLEDFQKRLWLKKKMIVQADYCITLDRVPEEFYPDIAANQAQHDEWVRLFAIDEIKGDTVTLPYTHPLTVDFLKSNPYLLVDTQFFDREWKYKLLATIDNIDEQCDGVLINSENFQALNFLSNRYKKTIRAIYIDPPYNTVHSEILYKNQFKHSSWLSLINNGITISKGLLLDTSSFGVAIDDYEVSNLNSLINQSFTEYDISIVIVNHHPQGSGGKLSRTHEYFIICTTTNSPNILGELSQDDIEDRSFMRSGTAENNYRYGRWKSFYALLYDPKKKKIIDVEDPIPLGNEIPFGDINGLKRIYPINSRGEERVWRSSYLTGRNRAQQGELTISESGTVYQTINHESKRQVLFSNWTDSKFNSGIHGSAILNSMGLGGEFDYPKSIHTMETAVIAQTFGDLNAIVLDFFGGSATTAHATINLNRKDQGKRKYILVEMGDYFNSVTKPRTQKVVYSKEWKDGKPDNCEGISHCFKYFRLESYEDTLNNLELLRTSDQHSLLSHENFGEEYLLHYMLGVESRDSLLNLKMFKKPFGYKLKVTQNNELKEKEVDLVETFNYFIGLVVESMQIIRGNVVVYGRNLQEEKILVIWRDVEQTDNKALNDFFRKLQINTRDSEFRRIYVNGDNNLENIRTDDEQWKVGLIEEEFQKRMFDTKDV